jgi:hypothetical protein
MYGESVLAAWIEPHLMGFDHYRWFAAHTVASVVAVSILTYFHIVIGEVVPKALALQAAQQTVLYVSPIVEWLEVPLSPFVRALNAAGNGLMALIGVRRQGNAGERYHTSEELRFIIEESQEGGQLRGESGRILRDLFEFGRHGHRRAARDHPAQSSHPVPDLHGRLRPHRRQRARQGAAATHHDQPPGHGSRCAAPPLPAEHGAAGPAAGGHATQPGAHGGRDG